MSNMINKSVIGNTGIPLLEKMMDLTTVRQKLISGNIANVSTPGYKSKDIDFQGELNKVLEKFEQGDKFFKTEAKVLEEKSAENNGINFVDIDDEMAKLAENQIYYNTAVKLISRQFDGLRKAITSK